MPGSGDGCILLVPVSFELNESKDLECCWRGARADGKAEDAGGRWVTHGPVPLRRREEVGCSTQVQLVTSDRRGQMQTCQIWRVTRISCLVL